MLSFAQCLPKLIRSILMVQILLTRIVCIVRIDCRIVVNCRVIVPIVKGDLRCVLVLIFTVWVVSLDSVPVFVDEYELSLDSPLRDTFSSLIRCFNCRVMFIFHSDADQYDCTEDYSDKGASSNENVKNIH